MAGADTTEDMPATSPSAPEIIDFDIRRFLLDVEFLFRDELSARKLNLLNAIKSDQERHLHALGEVRENAELDAVEFVIEFNKMTERFQMGIAEVLDAGEYRRLLGEERGEVSFDKDFIQCGGIQDIERPGFELSGCGSLDTLL